MNWQSLFTRAFQVAAMVWATANAPAADAAKPNILFIAVDDLWQLGKARGGGGPWKNAVVKAEEASDAYLAAGYDRKRLTLSHTNTTPVTFRVEADFTGAGKFTEVIKLTVPPGQQLEHSFPDAFGAYWLRLIADNNTTATAMFTYE